MRLPLADILSEEETWLLRNRFLFCCPNTVTHFRFSSIYKQLADLEIFRFDFF